MDSWPLPSPIPDGSSGIDSTIAPYAAPAYGSNLCAASVRCPNLEAPIVTAPVEPTIAPLAPPVGPDTPVGDSTDYPDSGVDNPRTATRLSNSSTSSVQRPDTNVSGRFIFALTSPAFTLPLSLPVIFNRLWRFSLPIPHY